MCNVAYLYNRTILGQTIQCRHCRTIFTAVEATSLSPHIDKYIRLGSPAFRYHGNMSGVDSASSPFHQHDKHAKSCGVDSQAFVKFEALNRYRMKAFAEREQENINGKDTVVAGAESPRTSALVEINSLEGSNLPGDHNFFKKGIVLMIRGFKDMLLSAGVEKLDDLLLYGGMIVRAIIDLGLPDPGVSVLLENLKLQAAEIRKHFSNVSYFKRMHESCADKVNRTCGQISDMHVLLASLGEQVVGLTESVRRARKSWVELIVKEEGTRKTRIQAEEDLACMEKQLLACQTSITVATDACKNMEETNSMAKELLAKAEEDLQSATEILAASEAKWGRLCEEILKALLV